MSISMELNEKVRTREKCARTFFFLVSKLILIAIFSGTFLKTKILDLATDAEWTKESYVDLLIIMVIVGGLLYFISFGINKVEEIFIKNITDSVDFRKKILPSDHFIEGLWFIGTIQGTEVVEYALAKITYSNGMLCLNGKLFKITNNGVARRFGNFFSLVGEFFTEEKKYIYAYERKSDIEKNDPHYKNIGGESFGKGEYRFQFEESEKSHIQFVGDYFDPVSDNLMQLRGIRVEYMQKNHNLTSKISFNSDSSVYEMHTIFMKNNHGLTFKT